MYDAYVIFEDSPSLWTRPFKRHFRHVSVILPFSDGWYVHVNPRMSKLDFTLVTQNDINAMYDKTLYHDIAIVQTKVDHEVDKLHLPMFFTCVELVKRALGIYKWNILTPKQLYSYLCQQANRDLIINMTKRR